MQLCFVLFSASPVYIIRSLLFTFSKQHTHLHDHQQTHSLSWHCGVCLRPLLLMPHMLRKGRAKLSETAPSLGGETRAHELRVLEEKSGTTRTQPCRRKLSRVVGSLSAQCAPDARPDQPGQHRSASTTRSEGPAAVPSQNATDDRHRTSRLDTPCCGLPVACHPPH